MPETEDRKSFRLRLFHASPSDTKWDNQLLNTPFFNGPVSLSLGGVLYMLNSNYAQNHALM